MTTPADDRGRTLRVQAVLQSSTRWLVVPLRAGGKVTIEMVLDTGSPFSAISEGTRDALADLGLIPSRSRSRYMLTDLTIEAQPIAALPVAVSSRVTAVGAQGLLGLSFLARFRTLHFDRDTLLLTLTY